MKRSSKKGFTLAELLIVIAIIAILIAIMFPVFGAQLDKARAAAELANVRAKYSELVADAMLADTKTTDGKFSLTVSEGDSIVVKKEDIKKALMYTQTRVKMTDAGANDHGTIKVTYKDYSGEFNTDKDVTFDNHEPFGK